MFTYLACVVSEIPAEIELPKDTLYESFEHLTEVDSCWCWICSVDELLSWKKTKKKHFKWMNK